MRMPSGAWCAKVVTEPSNFRANRGFADWMSQSGRIGIAGVDTRSLTQLVRSEGPPNIAIAHRESGQFDLETLQKMAAEWPGLEGMDLAKDVSRQQVERWTGGKWAWGRGYELGGEKDDGPHVVAIDYGNKRNIFRNLVEAGARVTVVPATATFDEIMTHEPDGFFLSNGPGDPAATSEYAVPIIRKLLDTKKPLFGICLGHQMLALAVGGRTSKMFQGHRGANHPVKRLADGRVEITSMNHGFAVEREGLPDHVRETHVSLFDGSNCGLELTDTPAFSVQYHPEAKPGPAGQFLPVREVHRDDAMTPLSFRVGILAPLCGVTACASAQLHTEAQLNEVALSYGLSIGEVVQEEEAKRLLFLYRVAPAPAQRHCVYQWAHNNHLNLVLINAINDPAASEPHG